MATTYGNPEAVGGPCGVTWYPEPEPDPLVERLREEISNIIGDQSDGKVITVAGGQAIEHLANAIRALEGR